MQFGLDYVSGPPLTAMHAANVAFVCRYLSYVNSATQVKLLTLAEADTLSHANIAIVSNYEWYAERALEGVTSGQQDAQIAASQHHACGGPGDRPIYFSVDMNVQGSQVVNYFHGIHDVLPLSRIGAYGSCQVIKYLLDNHLITWAWQTYAWSGGQWDPRRHIEQYQNGVSMSGASVDYNHALTSDFGQWGVSTMTVIDITTPGVANFFDEVDSHHWRCKSTGKVIQFAVLDAYKKYGNSELCGITFLGLPVSNEIPLDAQGNVKQHFERGVLFYDPQHVIDNPPGAGIVYAAHLYSGAGVDPGIAQLEAQLTAAQKPMVVGVDPAKVTAFQAGIAQKAEDIVGLAKALETTSLVPLA